MSKLTIRTEMTARNISTANWVAADTTTESIRKFRIRVFSQAAFILGLLIVNQLAVAGNFIFYLILALLATRSAEWTVRSLSLAGLMLVITPLIAPHGSSFNLLKFLFLAWVGICILRRTSAPLKKPFITLFLLFVLVATTLSLWNGYYVPISLLKLFSFSYGCLCILALCSLKQGGINRLEVWFLAMMLAFVIASFLLQLAGLGSGVFRTAWGIIISGFRGAASHPQTLGIVACMFAIYGTSLYLYSDIRDRKLLSVVTIGMLGLIYLSASRTALLSYLITVCAMMLIAPLSKTSRLSKLRLKKSYQRLLRIGMLGGIIVLTSEITSGRVSNSITNFLQKDEGHSELTLEAIYDSRLKKIERSWRNFNNSPFTGIGFGTDLDPLWQRTATLLSASSEKGFLPTAVLEEVGLVGAVFFSLFLLSFATYLLTSGNLVALSLLIGLLAINLGEMIFFAFGASGLFCWMLIGGALASHTENRSPTARQVPL